MNHEKLVRTAHAVGQNCFHMIWAPKYRFPVFRYESMRKKCEEALIEISKNHSIILHEICIEDDHLHLFAEIPATMSVSKAFQLLKGGSSYLLRKRNKWMRKYKALWSIGKFYRSVGSVTDEAIERYINDGHHLTKIPKDQTKLA